MSSTDPFLDPLIHLAYVAAVTERMELGTGVIVLPQRNPLVLAKQAALGVPMSERGSRTDEYLDAMAALWSDPAPVSYQGRHVSFQNLDARPRPAQPGGPRIVVGGESPAAFRRAVTRGHAWFGIGRSPDVLQKRLRQLEQAAAEVERPARLGRLEIYFMQGDPVAVDADMAKRYADLGLDRLLLYPAPLEDPDHVARFLEQHADLPLSG